MSPSPLPPPRRSLGQNFLVAGAAVRRIVDALGAGSDDPVLEIGPGRGALTLALLAGGARVVAIERDRLLARRLLALRHDRLRVLEADVLDVDLAQLANEFDVTSPWLVVGNLPYNISKPIAMQLIRQRTAVGRAVLMFQREVAQRLTAGPGSKRYAPLSVLADAAYRIESLFELGPAAFRPRPKVVSTVTRWHSRPDAPDDDELDRLARCLAACFAARRRTLHNNLRRALGAEAAAALLGAAAIDGELRAERLDRVQLTTLATLWPADRQPRP